MLDSRSLNPEVPHLWVLVGATGTGKTALSLDLAEHLAKTGRGAEVINADAMQVYTGMNIGTAKISPPERRGISHHLLDVLEVTQESSVAWYQPLARETVMQVHGRGRDVIVVGGSGLYVSSLIYNFDFPPQDPLLRSRLELELKTLGLPALMERLRRLDPLTADRIDPRNIRRVIRALEIVELGATTHQAALPQVPSLWLPNTTIVGVDVPRAELVERLDNRVSQMWVGGMLQEVRELQILGLERGVTASRAIGYAQALDQMRGVITEQEAISQTQALTRRYARRQVSWFRRYPTLQWYSPEADDILPRIVNGYHSITDSTQLDAATP